MGSLLAVIFFVVVCAIAVDALSNVKAVSKTAPSKPKHASEPADLDSLPYIRRRYFFSAAERSFYEILKRLTTGYTVFAKVRLADLISISKGADSWQAHFNRIQSKHIDFVVCDRDLAPILAIELDDSSHEREDRRVRDEFVNAALAAAALPILHFQAKRAYVLDEIRREIDAHLHMESPALPASDLGYQALVKG